MKNSIDSRLGRSLLFLLQDVSYEVEVNTNSSTGTPEGVIMQFYMASDVFMRGVGTVLA